eukprot:TRINITY_DN65573_c0_g1_i1.p1 TRINITY_DN65573_c0_g1~~TRINITY_DN65573_c0_g1_i1.p1  ORF type:complete len:442 (+),score=118.64 TRINITY_DN65573_c0_g1_i1:76-1326(+)
MPPGPALADEGAAAADGHPAAGAAPGQPPGAEYPACVLCCARLRAPLGQLQPCALCYCACCDACTRLTRVTAGEALRLPRQWLPRSAVRVCVRCCGRSGAVWLPDASAVLCAACRRPFTLRRRRHHCRRCGRLFCGRCTARRQPLVADAEGWGRERVCDSCARADPPRRSSIPSDKLPDPSGILSPSSEPSPPSVGSASPSRRVAAALRSSSLRLRSTVDATAELFTRAVTDRWLAATHTAARQPPPPGHPAHSGHTPGARRGSDSASLGSMATPPRVDSSSESGEPPEDEATRRRRAALRLLVRTPSPEAPPPARAQAAGAAPAAAALSEGSALSPGAPSAAGSGSGLEDLAAELAPPSAAAVAVSAVAGPPLPLPAAGESPATAPSGGLDDLCAELLGASAVRLPPAQRPAALQ